MQFNSYTKFSKFLMAPALIALLTGCGSSATDSALNDTTTIATNTLQTEIITQDTTTQTQDLLLVQNETNIDPMEVIDIGDIAVRSSGTQTFDSENEMVSNWVIFDNTPAGAQVKNVNLNGDNVIFLDGKGIENGFSLRRDDGSYLNNTDATQIQWESKFYDDFIIYVAVKLDDGSLKYLAYRPRTSANYDNVLTFKLPDMTETGEWVTTTRDLTADLHQYLPERSIESVMDFQVRGKGCIDDIILSTETGNSTTTDTSNTTPDTVDLGNIVSDNGNFSFTIDADFNINVSSHIAVSGTGTNIDQDALAQQLTLDLQEKLDALLGGMTQSNTTVDANVQLSLLFQQFQTQLSTIMAMLAQMPAITDANNTTTNTTVDTTTFNNQLAALLALLTQMQNVGSSSGVSVDINALMEQFQQSMAPMMDVIPQMFEMANKGMDMMDPEKYIPSMMEMAAQVMDFSKYLVDTTADLIKDPSVDHELYVNAMLRLSDDIGLMADRILVMADKMLVMGDKMEEVAMRMLDLMDETQANLLIAQQNFNALLLGLAGA